MEEYIYNLKYKSVGIYKITSPSGKVYIGQSLDVKRRLLSYLRKNKKVKGQIRLWNSFNKYGTENHLYELIEECLPEETNVRERYWQDFYDVLGKKGLNCQLVATDKLPKVVTIETRIKMSASQRARIKKNGVHKISEETRKKMSLSASIKFKVNGSPLKGKSNWHKGKNWSDETKYKRFLLCNNKVKPNSKIVLDLQIGVYYWSIREAALAINMGRVLLQNRLGGQTVNKTSLILC